MPPLPLVPGSVPALLLAPPVLVPALLVLPPSLLVPALVCVVPALLVEPALLVVLPPSGMTLVPPEVVVEPPLLLPPTAQFSGKEGKSEQPPQERAAPPSTRYRHVFMIFSESSASPKDREAGVHDVQPLL